MKLIDTELNADERQLIENSLLRGEELLWVGKPVPRLWAPTSLFMMFFGIVFLSISVFAFSYIEGSEMLFCLPFLLFGVSAMAAPWIGMSWQKKSVYALTNRRSLVFRCIFWKRHQMVFPVAKVMLLDRKVSSRDLVSLVLGKSSVASTNDVPDPEGFLDLSAEAAAVVEPLILELESSQSQ